MSFCKIDVVEIPFPVLNHSQKMISDVEEHEFGGTFQNPNYLNNPMYIVDVEEQMSFQFKTEISNPEVNCMICLIGIDTDLDDPRHVNYDYYLKQANPGMYNLGVSELNCLLEVGRYLLVCALQSTDKKPCKLVVHVSSYAEKMSDHPLVHEKQHGTNSRSFTMKKVERAKLGAHLKFYNKQTGTLPARRSVAAREYSTPTFSEFHTNPGVILKTKVPTKVILHMKSVSYDKSYQKALFSEFRHQPIEPPGLSICVMKINGLDDIKPIIEKEESTPASWGCWTKYTHFIIESYRLNHMQKVIWLCVYPIMMMWQTISN